MRYRTILFLFLYIGIVSILPASVSAEDAVAPPIYEESPVPPLEPASSSPVLLSEEEPEIIWGCAMQYLNGSDIETEHCGMGFYRELCMVSAGVEECIEFFEFVADGPSNVLFLPGIKGSRLYDGDGNKLWEPFGDHDVEDLMLDANGKSLRDDIHTEPGDIVDSVAVFTDIYGSFMDFMDDMVEDGTINAWEPFAYDWRLSLPDIVDAAPEMPDHNPIPLSLGTPYLYATLQDLADRSKSGKVTIVAHSNGGLVAKQLMKSIGSEATAQYIDKVIFVGVPQSGAPQALGALLYGYREGLPWWLPSIVSTSAARRFAENSPMGYHLLPSASYFADVQDTEHPVGKFEAIHSYEEERISYGETIDSYDELVSFALAEDGGRDKPHPVAFWSANVLNDNLLQYAEDIHESVDSWLPPQGVAVYQIAGWGEDTVVGIKFFERCALSLCAEMYDPILAEDGDGVVPVPSALQMSGNENVKQYWIDLQPYGYGNLGKKTHGNLLSIDELQMFIESIFLEEPLLPENIFDEDIGDDAGANRLHFFLHSPLTLELFDSDGNRTGPETDESLGENIPGSQYGQFGEVQFISAPIGPEYRLELNGYDSGTFALEIQEVSGVDVVASTTFAEIPTTPNTVVNLALGNSIDESDEMTVDINGDGESDAIIRARLGEIVSYQDLPVELSNNQRTSKINQKRKEAYQTELSSTEQLRLTLYIQILELLLEYLQEQRLLL